jgi:hypothetical protein
MWGGDWHPELMPRPGDVLIEQHWARTDLSIPISFSSSSNAASKSVIGMLANTCVEATARSGAELGYHVTLVRDATAAFSSEAMHAAHELNGPTFSHAILTTNEVIAVLGKP